MALASTGNIYWAAGVNAATKHSLTQGAYYLTDKDKFNPSKAAGDAAWDFGMGIVGGKVAGKIVKPNNTLHNHNWAKNTIKNYKTAFKGQYAQNQLWISGGIETGITGLADGIKQRIGRK